MSTIGLTTSPVWSAVGWTMLHLLWIGALIGLIAAFFRRALRLTGPELRYGIACMCMLMFVLSPALIFAIVYEPAIAGEISLERAIDGRSSDLALQVNSIPGRMPAPSLTVFAWKRSIETLARTHLETWVPLLPWIWMCGSGFTLITLATGLIGVESLRRSSRLAGCVDLQAHCDAFANALGIVRHVTVGICDRLAMPVLLGIVRPMILLPPAALCGWSAEQLEMVLLHELAHLRRWDNLVNLLQRVAESLLFFHPVVWWLSGWARLERELCCEYHQPRLKRLLRAPGPRRIRLGVRTSVSARS